MAALAYSSALQNRIAGLLFGSTYSNLTADQKTLLDGTSSASPPTTGVAKDAWDEVQKWSQWVDLSGGQAADDAERWFVNQAAAYMALQMRPDRLEQFERVAKREFVSYIRAFSRKSITYSPGADTEAWSLTTQNIRYYVINRYVHERKPEDWMMIPIELIDSAIQKCLMLLWNGYNWPFRRRQVTMTVTTASAVTFNLSGSETFLSFASRDAYFDDSDSSGAMLMSWANADEMAALIAVRESQSMTGRPQRFRFERTSSGNTWQFYPTPDQTYTARCEVFIAGPGTPSSASDATPYSLFPDTCRPLIRELVYYEVVGDFTRRDAVLAQFEDYVPRFTDVGGVDTDQSVRDIYGDYAAHKLGYSPNTWGL